MRQLQDVNQGITDALTEQLGIKNRFVKDLFSIFLDEVVFRPLADALRNGQSGGGGFFGSLFNSLGSIFGFTSGRASGGYVGPGSIHRVNEHKGGVELLRMGSQGGQVIPLGQVNAAAARPGQGQGAVARVQIELSGEIDGRIARVSGPVAVEVVRSAAPAIVDNAAKETMRRASRPGL